MDYKELTTKSEAELSKMLEDLRAEAHDMKMKISLGQAKSSHKLKVMKKDIAKIMTFLGK